MNSTFKFKLIQALNKKNGNKGFTLIELLVVVIIIGVLAAIALPNLLGQVAKGRQAEARNNLGVVNRAQQAYRLENATFTTMTLLPVTTTGIYYSAIANVGTPDTLSAVQNAVALPQYTNDIRDYSAAVGQTAAGVFTSVICETTEPTTPVVNATVTTGTVQTCAVNSRPVQ
ncbi:MAG: prepilin-type N-terminal cleavage/methylation domain-containing protein [Microcystis novacekii Mn_MB_F_20050700_S1]|uniref:Prepilin-type N-terminal cleavage/methylation domain-containing protein n=1 Tax=Microcystis novacekii Mn_MB_F_20050700_S1D TaxID=2486266 RepID=A0A552IPM1_9CHRO|nr:MAG: prepilin-type N-terminal cleavage/methylation domain-containing protein [Microcystis novacekii Mn_MB_F_20050700_S1D]TRU88168.1 MAG: prepilin-type N-terminal cleavage/methylation domain-containing protein [Microcystis novacekii Mn_MB_F_20050700_S1]